MITTINMDLDKQNQVSHKYGMKAVLVGDNITKSKIKYVKINGKKLSVKTYKSTKYKIVLKTSATIKLNSKVNTVEVSTSSGYSKTSVKLGYSYPEYFQDKAEFLTMNAKVGDKLAFAYNHDDFITHTIIISDGLKVDKYDNIIPTKQGTYKFKILLTAKAGQIVIKNYTVNVTKEEKKSTTRYLFKEERYERC